MKVDDGEKNREIERLERIVSEIIQSLVFSK